VHVRDRKHRRPRQTTVDALEQRLLLSTASSNVNAAVPVSGASSSLSTVLGVNLTWWDRELSTSQTKQLVQSAGLNLFRFPGGSSTDGYHFNILNNFSDPINNGSDTVSGTLLGIAGSAVAGNPDNTIPKFVQFIEAVNDTGTITLDYGSGSPQEAEAELAYLEGSPSDTTAIGDGIEWNDSLNGGRGAWQTVNWQSVGFWASLRSSAPQDGNADYLRINHPAPFPQVKYWEVGNEEYGNWEIDHHGTPGPGGASTGSQHNPGTCAAFVDAFAHFVAVDQGNLPKILIGIDSEDPTGGLDNGWTKTVLKDSMAAGFTPGFISDHSYAYVSGAGADTQLLYNTVSNPASIYDWSTRYSAYQNLLQQVGLQPNSVPVLATEFNSFTGNVSKLFTSLTNGLFLADSLGGLMDSGYAGGIVWDLRFTWFPDNSPGLYGWRMGGDFGLLGDPNPANAKPPSTGPYIPYPTYFAEQLVSNIAQSGGRLVPAGSSSQDLDVFAVKEPNGHLDLLVINKNSSSSITDQFNISGFQPNGQAQVWQYGQAQDNAQSQTSNGAASLASFDSTLSLSASNFSYTFPAYSMTVLDLSPGTVVAGGGSITGVAGTTNLVTLEASAVSGVLATFKDSNPNAGADLHASVNWGDGTTSTAAIVNASNGGFQVTGSHTYRNPSTYFATVSISDSAAGSAQATAKIYVADAPMHPIPATITATAGRSFTGVVASFIDWDPNAQLSYHTASITWGDGHMSQGIVDGAIRGFDVIGTNTYASGGQYRVDVYVNDVGGMNLQIVSRATVASAAIAGPVPQIQGAGSVNAGSNYTVQFSATDPGGQSISKWVIDWGDGAVVTLSGNATSASHIYSTAPATRTAKATATDNAGLSASASLLVQVHAISGRSTLTASGTNNLITIEGSALSGVLATFTDSNPNFTSGYYTASIAWGDGTSGSGTVSYNSATGRFQVTGSQTYKFDSTYRAIVSIVDAAAGSASATAQIYVADAPFHPLGTTIQAVAGHSFSGIVGSFVDDDPNSTPSYYSTLITWGDGHMSSGAVTFNSITRRYEVSGTNIYGSGGTYPLSIYVKEIGGMNVTIRSTAEVSG
jgi:alpha-L-arabinofuranosidase